MGFLDILGDVAGKLVAQGQEIQSLKDEYELMNNNDLVREYNYLKGKSGSEQRNRFTAVMIILKERGVIKDNTN